jgi:hypothetical protein
MPDNFDIIHQSRPGSVIGPVVKRFGERRAQAE